jgi:hypothetical protein
MDELISRITAAVDLDATSAKSAVGLMLAFLQKEGEAGAVATMMDKFPGAADLAGEPHSLAAAFWAAASWASAKN